MSALNSMIILQAPAKINWSLHVYGLRDDGYHEISSLIQKVSLFDTVSLSPATELTVLSELDMPQEQNLVHKAARLLRDESGVEAGAVIKLKKNIPVSAGLGGGSSDAAATLLGLNQLWSLDLEADRLRSLAARIGSDVPFFLGGPLALVEGMGEKVTFHSPESPSDILLVKPHAAVSTRWAYKNLDAARDFVSFAELTNNRDKVDNTTPFIREVSKAQVRGNSRAHNDLEPVTVKSFPVIADIKNRMLDKGAVFSMMSGSGPTVFGVFSTAEEAVGASRHFDDCWTAVVRTIVE